MNDTEMTNGTPHADKLMREASTWFARMRGPDAETYRSEFNAWLARAPSHIGAYNYAGEIFAMGRFLAAERERDTAQANDNERRLLPRFKVAAAVGLAIALGLGGWYGFVQRNRPDQSTEIATKTSPSPAEDKWNYFTTDPGAQRTVRLADGSVIQLSAGSTLLTKFSPKKRELRLEAGQGRFEVAHDGRPFTVFAGGGSVTARGTIFDVILAPNKRVTVHLLRGIVDVQHPFRGKSEGSPRLITRLSPGDSLSFAAALPPPPSAQSLQSEKALPMSVPHIAVIREFEQTPLSSLVAEANRNSATTIRIADPDIGILRVSGRFRIDDPNQVAERLAALFDLQMVKGRPGEITLRRH